MPQESSAARVAGKTCRNFSYNGVTYLLSQPLRMHSYQDEEAFILYKRQDPMLSGVATYHKLPAAVQVAMWEGCARAGMGGIPSQDEWLTYGTSAWKEAYMFWQTLDPKHKVDKETKEPIDLIAGVEWAVNFMRLLPVDKLLELRIIIAFVSQDEAIKNSSGRTAPAEPAPDPAPDIPATTDGPPSTNTSETDTNSAPTK
jgi:hypothetical protein